MKAKVQKAPQEKQKKITKIVQEQIVLILCKFPFTAIISKRDVGRLKKQTLNA